MVALLLPSCRLKYRCVHEDRVTSYGWPFSFPWARVDIYTKRDGFFLPKGTSLVPIFVSMAKKSTLQKRKDNPNSTYWGKRAMAAWSAKVCEGGKCEKCGSTGKLDAHHLQSRRFRNTRYVLLNGICLCPRCHKFGNESAHQSMLFFVWLRTHKPEQWDYMLHHYNDPDPRTCKDVYDELSSS